MGKSEFERLVKKTTLFRGRIKLMSMSQMPICGSDTATNLILSQVQSIRAVLVLPTVTGAMFVCGDMAP